jgi:hypothetical protein
LKEPNRSSAPISFEQALLRGEASGYAICAKPLRFAKLSDAIASSFVELDEENRYHVFELEAEAARRLEQIPADERLGRVLSVQKVRYLPDWTSRDAPQFDATGHPFEMRGFVIDQTGAVKEWKHSGRLGWREVPEATETSGPVEPRLSLRQWLKAKLSPRANNAPL